MLQTQTFTTYAAISPVRTAAMYVRMSTDHQKYSTENQAEAIQEYARRHNIRVISEYKDAGKSGLSLDGRDALKRLIDDVQTGKADFSMILVLDVTRWGRFQDADESAYYEYICRRAGIDVQYIAEQFENDGSPVSTIVKGVKRAMAGEYSRELSAKVFAGQCRLIEKGFRQGGPAGYGLRRVLMAENGELKAELRRGEHKSLQTDRVILVPGPPEELDVIHEIYRNFVDEGLSEMQIAHLLNQQGLKSEYGRQWSRSMVHQILTNEKYIGNNVFNRISHKLKKRRVVNAPDMWVRSNGVFAAIVEPEIFARAQQVIEARSRRWSDDELLTRLKELYTRNGWLSGILIDETEDMPGMSLYSSRFGSLIAAYKLIGYTPDHDYRFIEINRRLKRLQAEIAAQIIEKIKMLGTSIQPASLANSFMVHEEVSVAVVVCRCLDSVKGILRWNVALNSKAPADITIAVRMDESNQNPLDYYFLPSLDIEDKELRLFETNSLALDNYRFETLEPFVDMSQRILLKEISL